MAGSLMKKNIAASNTKDNATTKKGVFTVLASSVPLTQQETGCQQWRDGRPQ